MAALPVIRGTSAALYPFTMEICFRTIIGRFQNGSEQRSIGNPGGLMKFEIPYGKLTRGQKSTVKAYVVAAKGGYDTTGSITLGSTTYTNLNLDSDIFEGIEEEQTIYSAPLKLSQVLTQSLSPGTPGLAFPTLANGALGTRPYTQRTVFQTVKANLSSGIVTSTPEFGGGLTGYPTANLWSWTFDEHMLTDADAATLLAHFIANYGRAYSFQFTDENAAVFSHALGTGSPHYSTDSLLFRYNGPNDTDVKIGIDLTFN